MTSTPMQLREKDGLHGAVVLVERPESLVGRLVLPTGCAVRGWGGIPVLAQNTGIQDSMPKGDALRSVYHGAAKLVSEWDVANRLPRCCERVDPR